MWEAIVKVQIVLETVEEAQEFQVRIGLYNSQLMCKKLQSLSEKLGGNSIYDAG